MSAYVKKIQFKLHESYGNPLRGGFCISAGFPRIGLLFRLYHGVNTSVLLLQLLPNHHTKSPKQAGVNLK